MAVVVNVDIIYNINCVAARKKRNIEENSDSTSPKASMLWQLNDRV